ncbi:hypothetical protein [Gimesia algae]|uniref:Uncharacterized protein n=1 Tax=Gimesia algae TaxID=2527971 RepID=A0A517VCZ3_9PLAN|nr:hypothetical protein [Gimesia algae]QDT90875.1 hypothetical protein Pan161_25290 [Gimesia algae]
MPCISASRVNAASFSIFKRSMLQDASLPLSDVINDQRWQQVFDEHEINFGNGSPLRSPYKARAVYGSCRHPFAVVL